MCVQSDGKNSPPYVPFLCVNSLRSHKKNDICEKCRRKSIGKGKGKIVMCMKLVNELIS